MASNSIKVTVRFKWWFTNIYMPLLVIVTVICRLIDKDSSPNWDKFNFWLDRGTIIHVSSE